MNVFNEINNGILQYMEKKSISRIQEIVGLAKKS